MSKKDNIRVVVRFRPTRSNRRAEDDPYPADFDEKNNIVLIPGKPGRKPNEFSFDLVMGPSISQEQFFKQVAEESCLGVLEGFNVTLFCYGQSGSGKTHTMFGPDADYLDPNETMKSAQMGLIPRAASFIFNYVEGIDSDPNVDSITVKAACLEVYMEKMRDLLDPTSKKELKIMQNKSRGTYVNNLSWKTILQPMDVIKCIIISMQNRHVESTNLNATSSRSHAIISLEVTKRLTDSRGETKGLIHFCDLAGSEKLKSTGAQGLTAKQGMMINKSLFSLGAVIQKLAKGSKHVPYRDSVLTKVLQDALGGNSRTTLIVAASYHTLSREETLSSMRFAKSCKTIKNKAKANVKESTKELHMKIERLEQEIERLNKIIEENAAEGGKASKELQSVFNAQLQAVNEDKKKVLADVQKLKAEIEDKEDIIDEMTRNIQQISSERDETVEKAHLNEEINGELKAKIVELESTIALQKESHETLRLQEQSSQREIDGLKKQIKIAEEQQEQAKLKARRQSLKLTGTREELQKELSRMRASIIEFENLASSHKENYENLRLEKITIAEELDKTKLELGSEQERLSGLIGDKEAELEKFKAASEAVRVELEKLLTEQTEQLKKESLSMEEKFELTLNQKDQELAMKNDIISKLEQRIADSGKIEDLKETFISSLKNMKKEQAADDQKIPQSVQVELIQLKKSIEDMKKHQKQDSYVRMPTLAKGGGIFTSISVGTMRAKTFRKTSRNLSLMRLPGAGFSLAPQKSTKEDLVFKKVAQMTEMLAIREQLCEADAKVAEELAAQYDRELMQEQEERQRIEEEDARFVQWLANHEKDGMAYLEKEIPEEVKTFMKILRINRELTSLEYAQLIEYYEDTEREKRDKADAMIKTPSLREFQKSEFDNGKARKVSWSQKVIERGFTEKQREQLFEKKYDSSSEQENENDKRASVFNSHPNLLQAQEKAVYKSQSNAGRRTPSEERKMNEIAARGMIRRGQREESKQSSPRSSHISRAEAKEPVWSLEKQTSLKDVDIHIDIGAPRPSYQENLPRPSFREGMERHSLISSRASASYSMLDYGQPRGSQRDGINTVEQKKRKRKKRTQFTATFNPLYKLGARLYTEGERCQVEMVKEGGQLQNMGLQAGSIITKINNMRIRRCEDFTNALQALRSSQISEAVMGWRNENLAIPSQPKVEDEFNSFLTGLAVIDKSAPK